MKPLSKMTWTGVSGAGLALITLTASAGCLGDLNTEEVDGPAIVATSTQAVKIGDSVEFYGAKFVFSNQDHTALRFTGTFTPASGPAIPVDLRIRPHWVDGNRLVWAQIGPYTNPFSKDDQLGAFDGEVTAINVLGDGTETASRPYPMRLAFEESIAIRMLEPLNAGCGEPVKRLLGGFPYHITVEAVGFTPVNFTYAIGGEAARARARVYRRRASGQTDTFGDKNELVFDPVPDDVAFQLVNLSISALGTDGKERFNSIVFALHRPIEYVDSGTFKVAEILAPTPDSGCISGGPIGRTVTYTESHTDTRSRQIGINWTEAWSESSTETKTLSQAVTRGITITRSGSETTTSTTGWSTEVGAHGGVTLKGIFEVGVEGKKGWNGSFSRAYTNGWSVGRDYSTTDTESWAFAKSRGYTLTKGGQDFWTVTSADSKSLAFTGQILPEQYGVFYRQTVRVALPGSLVAYDLCGNPAVVGKTNFFDYNWSVDLAVGSSCPPYPQPKLPEAQCYVTPCSNQ